jgi:hypothetical protein
MKNSNPKFKSPVVRKPVPSTAVPITKNKACRNEVIELQKLIAKWKSISQDIIQDLQTEETLQELAQTLRFDIQMIGDYDVSQDCFQ